MLRRKMILWFLALLLLTGCSKPITEATDIPSDPEAVPVTSAPTEAPTQVSTEPPHSELYIPGVSAEDVFLYFNEVCMNAEFINSGDPSYLQRWESPISYGIYGTPTPEDRTKIAEFAQWLNRIDGFPGMYEAGEGEYVNLRIHFTDQQGLLDLMGDQFQGTDGAVTFWYEENRIFDATVCIRTDLSQNLRNSVILEEIYNGLGPIQDTDLRPDSIIYSAYSEPQSLTQIDELILKLLYHPSLSCGMDAAQCEADIRTLYH